MGKNNKDSKKNKDDKYPKEEMEPYNPFAVCTKSVGKDDKEKFERCVLKVKEQNKERNKKMKKDKKSSLEDKLMNRIAESQNLNSVWEFLRNSGILVDGQLFSGLEKLKNDLLSSSAGDIRLQQLANAISQFQSSMSNIVSRPEKKTW